MKFDLNKEFSFAQIGAFFKRHFEHTVQFIKKLDSSSIKNITINGKSVRINSIRLCTIVAVFAVMLALFINIVIIPHTTYRTYSDLEFDTGGEYRMYAYGSDILLLNNNGIKMVDNKGNDKWSQTYTLTNPMIDISGEYLLLADLDGNNTLNLFDTDGNNLLTYPIDSDILSAKINKSRLVAAAVDEEGYKGSVVVYNKKAQEIFKWNSGEGYVTDIDISNDGKYVAVAQMMSDRDEVYSKIHVLNISNGQEAANIECDSSLIAKVNFDKHDNIIAVGENKVFGYSKKGRQNYAIDLAGKSPQTYDISNGNYLVFLCRDSRGNSVLEIYSLSGKLLGSYNSSYELKNISVCGSNIVASTSRNLLYLSYRGKLKKTVEISHDIMSLGIYGNNRNVLVLGGNKADIIRIR